MAVKAINPHRIPCVWNGRRFQSIASAAYYHGIDPSAMRYRVMKGYTCDADVGEDNNLRTHQPCQWNGIRYGSIAEAARANGISWFAMKYRLVMGYGSNSDLRMPQKRLDGREGQLSEVNCER